LAVGKMRSATEAEKKTPAAGLGSRGSVVCCHQENHDERDITYDKSMPHCEDQKIGIVFFCAECCGLATTKRTD
jgi:hypothetical protein